MINPNDPQIMINPNDPQLKQSPAGGRVGGSSGVTTGSHTGGTQYPSTTSTSLPQGSDDGFDLDAALQGVENATPTPNPTIKHNPRNHDAVVENHHEDIQNGKHHPQAPIAPHVAQAIAPALAVATTIAPQPPQPQVSQKPSVPEVSPSAPSPEETVHQAYGIQQPPQMPTVSPVASLLSQSPVPQATQSLQSSSPSSPKPATPTKTNVVKTKKKGSRVSLVGFMVGCGILLFLLLGGGALLLWSMFQDPNQSWNVIGRESAETLLKLFAGVIFGGLSLLGIVLIFVNIFRIVAKKHTKKIGYVGGMVLGLFMVGVGLGAGIPAISKLNSLSLQSSSFGLIANPSVFLGNNEGMQSLMGDTPPHLVAPLKMMYTLDPTVYNVEKNKLGLQSNPTVQFDCGNGQLLSANTMNDGSIAFGPCYYTEKGDYPARVIMGYTDSATGQPTTHDVPVGSGLTIQSGIELMNVTGVQSASLASNNLGTELIAGTAPAKVSFNAQGVISDLQLPTNAISWDFDGDGVFERVDDVTFTHNFLTSKIHNIAYRIGTSPYTYTFPLRVEQSSIPICVVDVVESGDMSYQITTSFLEENATVTNYAFEVIDRGGNKKIDQVVSALGSISYDFVREGLYAVKVYYVTSDGTKGTCQSDDFRVGSVPYIVDHTMQFQGPGQASALSLQENDIATEEDGVIVLRTKPVKIEVVVDDVRPRSDTVRPVVIFDGEQKVSVDNRSFTVPVVAPGDHILQIGVYDELTNKTSVVVSYPLMVDLRPVEGKLLVSPDNVGKEPFKVVLDASTVTINDSEDEVVYFSRDFDDGETKKNQNQGTIEHTYYFDAQEQTGIYHPTATITTRKGRELTLELDDPITVQRALRHAKILFESHPAQRAAIGDRVLMSLVMDGLPAKVSRDFGDGETYQCKGRKCMDNAHVFVEPGRYVVQATVSYEDHPDVIAKTVIVVQ